MAIYDDIQQIADSLLSPPNLDPTTPQFSKYFETVRGACQTLLMSVQAIVGNDVMAALHYRNSVVQRMRDVSDMYRRASATGIFFSADPLLEFQRMNVGRELFEAIFRDNIANTSLFETVKYICDLLNKERSGTLVLSSGRPQVGSLSISFEGMQGIPSSLFNADSLKRQQALESLRTLDFTKRRPKVLFVAERDAETLDIVSGWKKMRDAAGYKLTLTDLKTMKSSSIDVRSSELETPDSVAQQFYAKTIFPVIGDSVKVKDVALYRFKNVSPNTIYSVQILPYQMTNTSPSNLFRGSLTRLVMTDQQLDQLKKLIMSFGAVGVDDVTPYPFISKMLYGSTEFGWILSGMNLLSSFERSETVTEVRSYSYIGAKYTDISAKITAGRFYVPSDINTLDEVLQRSFSEHGLSSTLFEVMDKCGMLMFFDEREGFDVESVSVNRASAIRETSLAKVILGAIDPVSATVSPRDVYRLVQGEVIASPPLPFGITIERLETPKLDTSNDVIDVLSFIGMSRLMNVMVDASRRAI